MRITNSQGKEVAHYDNFKGLSDRILLPAGTYTLVATSGEDVVADFEKPYYKAEQEVNIEAAVTKQVSLICTQANVKVTVECIFRKMGFDQIGIFNCYFHIRLSIH